LATPKKFLLMKTYFLHFVSFVMLVAVVQLSSCSSGDDDGVDPTVREITGISPETGTTGTVVTITGKGFSTTPEENVVKFNGVEATVSTATATELVVKVPAGATTGVVTVTIDSEVLTGPTFTYTEPQPTKTYFIRFKMNGVVKIYESSGPGYSSCGECSCSYLPPFNETDYAGIDICQSSTVTASMIQNLNGKTIAFNESVNFPQVSFNFAINDVNYGTDYITQTAGLNLKVTSVVADGSNLGADAYKVSGTFSCKVAKSDGSQGTDITDGTFVVRYTEDF
jgi:hypothetical protein